MKKGKDTEIKINEYSKIRNASDNRRNKNYKIYQLIDGKENPYRFMGMDFIKRKDLTVNIGDYQMVYSGRMEEGETLDTLFEKFNIIRPYDFTGHSLSVSDVIVLENDGELKAYFVDTVGFVELPGFLG